MALLAKSLDEVLAMDEKGRTAYFERYAGYIPDEPRTPYAIRVGSKTLFSDDTMDLRKQFDSLVRNARRRLLKEKTNADQLGSL